MKFRPCIDIHNGKVKQIVGGTLLDRGDLAEENFVSDMDAPDYARLYQKDGLKGGHVILLNPPSSEYYAQTKAQAMAALSAAPGCLQAGGGITPENALEYLRAGASHVIVTSWVFCDGQMSREHLKQLEDLAGRDRLVLDLSCRRRGDDYYVVTDRWQKFTDVRLSTQTLDELADHCAEFLIHAADVEGRRQGPEPALIRLLGNWGGIPVTYAGGIATEFDLDLLYREGRGKLDVTIGSALDLFGGALPYRRVLEYCSSHH